MNRDELIEALRSIPENLPVVVDVNGCAHSIGNIDILTVNYKRPFGQKLIFEDVREKVIFLGNIGNTDIEGYEI